MNLSCLPEKSYEYKGTELVLRPLVYAQHLELFEKINSLREEFEENPTDAQPQVMMLSMINAHLPWFFGFLLSPPDVPPEKKTMEMRKQIGDAVMFWPVEMIREIVSDFFLYIPSLDQLTQDVLNPLGLLTLSPLGKSSKGSSDTSPSETLADEEKSSGA